MYQFVLSVDDNEVEAGTAAQTLSSAKEKSRQTNVGGDGTLAWMFPS